MNRIIKKEIECGCDYVLPDYMGDVRKILMSRAQVVPGGKFLSEGGIEATGTVEYEILYSDSEGRLTAITTGADYSVEIPVDQAAYNDSLTEARAAAPSIRLSGPRKMSIRSAVEVYLEISESSAPTVLGDVFDGEREVESVSRPITVEGSLYSEAVEREYADIADRLEGILADEVEIISSGGFVRISEVQAVEGGVEIKGELIVTAIVKTPTQPPFAIRRTIPFSETVSIEGAEADMPASANAYVTVAEVGCADSDEGAQISVSATVGLLGVVYESQSIDVICDAYLKEYETVAEYSDFNYLGAGACQFFEHTVTEKIPRDALGISDVRDVIALSADVRSSSAERVGGTLKISGEIQLSGVACEINADESVGYVPIKYTLPYSIDVNNNCQFDDKTRINCRVSAPACEGALDADSLHTKISLDVRVKSNEEGAIRVLCCCSVGESRGAREGAAITVYYPTKQDTLFSVAKKYHTTTARLAEQNSISVSAALDSSDSLAGIKRLIIR